ncbi:hypothetical protein [Pontibacter sp. H249]|uniref:hypothetical protein n=1 Tax=Pontibacter sp. H249 TaxID=3133420 RepID=UPI0030BADB17
MNFDDIQKSWQTQHAPELINKESDKTIVSNLQERTKALQRKIIWTNIMMTVVLCLTSAAFVFILRKGFAPKTMWFDIGLVIMFGAILLSALAQWLKSVPWGNLKADSSSNEYISHTLKSLRFRDTSIRLITPLQMVISTIGLNLIYLDIFWDESWKLRLVMHLALIIVMVLVGGLSLYYSRLRYQELYEPIIKDLEALKSKLRDA